MKLIYKLPLLMLIFVSILMVHPDDSEAQKKHKPQKVCKYQEMGTASWYGGKFHGRKTSSGARFNKRALTAAHNTLPLNSWVKVTNLSNKKSIIVLVNDRMGVKTRLIDVSEKTAEVLGFKKKGLTKVRVECLKRK